jgi:transposase-like protein
MSQACIYCQSSKVVCNGLRRRKVRTKQNFLCRACDRQFVEPDGFERMRHSPEIIARAVHQHEDGFSLSKVKNHLYQHDDVNISRWTISKWKKKFGIFLKSDEFRNSARYQRKNSLR